MISDYPRIHFDQYVSLTNHSRDSFANKNIHHRSSQMVHHFTRQIDKDL